jgi:hypothetical protein
MIGGVWFVIETRRRHQRELAAQASQERLAGEQQAAEQQRLAKTPQQTKSPEEQNLARNQQPTPHPSLNPAPAVVFLTLNAGGVRGRDGSGTQTLVIPQGTPHAQLLLNLKDNSYPSYRVSLQMIGGAEVFSQRNVKPHSTRSGASFVFTVPSRKLASGDYALTLSGINPNGEVDDLNKSLFRIEKR